jgi:hypothetical protein
MDAAFLTALLKMNTPMRCRAVWLNTRANENARGVPRRTPPEIGYTVVPGNFSHFHRRGIARHRGARRK